jgi:integrase/recombinase XerD
MEMRAAIAEFMYSRDLSPASRLWYRARLGEFSDWLTTQDVREVEAITPGQVRGYLAHTHDHPTPKGQPRDSHTLHGYARALRAFLRWAASEELVVPSLPKKVVMPRMEAKVLPVLTERQTDAMFDACLTARDRAILAVLLDTGIRAAELTGLTLDRVCFSQDDAYLIVKGKGRKQREVGLGRRSRMLLHKYIHRYRRGREVGPVFVSRTGAALTVSGLDQILYRLRDRAKLGRVKTGAHTFRHTYAYRYIAAGGDLFRLARLMGHSTVTVTQGYLSAFSAREARRGFSVLDGR